MDCIIEPTALFPCQAQAAQDARRYTKEEWDAQRPFIEGMYPLKGMTLKIIADMLKHDRGFVATPRQLKRKITDWSLDKNLKASEVKVIIRKMEQRRLEGKETSFHVRGQYVEPTKINRWVKRLATDGKLADIHQECSSPPAATPEAISYETPPVTGPSSPDPWESTSENHHSIESLLAATHEAERSPNSMSSSSVPLKIQSGLSTIPENPELAQFHFDILAQNSDAMDICSSESMNEIQPNQTDGYSSTSRHSHSFDDVMDDTMMDDLAGQPFETNSYPPTLAHHSHAVNHSRYKPDALRKPTFLKSNQGGIPEPAQKRSIYSHYGNSAELECRITINNLRANYGSHDERVLQAISQLAGILCAKERYEAAEPILKHLAAIRRKMAGEEHPQTLLAFVDLSCLWLILGKVSDSEALCKSISMRASNVLSQSHPVSMAAKEVYAACLCEMGRYQEAEILFDEVLQIRRSSSSQDDPTAPAVLNAMENLSSMLEDQGHIPECSNILRKVVEINSVRYGCDHPNTWRASSILGQALYLKGALLEARSLLEEVSAKQNSTLGPIHPHSRYTRITLALVQGGLGQKHECEWKLRGILQSMQRLLEPPISRMFTVEMAIAQCLHDQEKYHEGECLARKAHDSHLKLRGSVHRGTCRIKRVLGRMYDDHGRFDDSLSMLGGAINGFAQLMGNDHGATKGCRAEYTEVVRQMEKLRRANIADQS